MKRSAISRLLVWLGAIGILGGALIWFQVQQYQQPNIEALPHCAEVMEEEPQACTTAELEAQRRSKFKMALAAVGAAMVTCLAIAVIAHLTLSRRFLSLSTSATLFGIAAWVVSLAVWGNGPAWLVYLGTPEAWNYNRPPSPTLHIGLLFLELFALVVILPSVTTVISGRRTARVESGISSGRS